MPSFSSDDIKNITRRQINIVTENQGFDLTIAGMNANAAKLLGVDNANKAFWDDYHSKCTSYEVEYRQINGLYAPTYTETDIQESAKRNSLTPPNIFFPFTPSIAYKQFAPLVDYDGWAVNQTRGIFFSTGPDARYELNILTNPVETLSLFKMIERLQNGIGGSGTTATTGTITAGSMAEQTLVSAVLPAISAGMPAYLYDGTAFASGAVPQYPLWEGPLLPCTTPFVPRLHWVLDANVDDFMRLVHTRWCMFLCCV